MNNLVEQTIDSSDGEQTARIDAPTIQKRDAPWIALIVAACACLAIYEIYLHPDKAELRPLETGWFDLSSCAVTRSFDGTKWLLLSDDRSAELRESKKSEEGKGPLSKGEWRYDEATTQYAITINGETTSYSLFSTDDINTCMLVKGDIASADLRESWFTTISSPDQYDR
jgi:hypothetical protein